MVSVVVVVIVEVITEAMLDKKVVETVMLINEVGVIIVPM